MNIVQSPSPNFGERNGTKIDMIVVHCTDGNYPWDLQWLQNPQSQVSSHYVIAPDGTINQLVQEDKVAWHAGRVDNPTAPLVVQRPGVNPNIYSIGIENSMIGTNTQDPREYQSLKDLVSSLCAKYNIPIDRTHIVGHHEIYNPKTCPGTISVDKLVKDLTPPTNNDAIKKQIIDLVNKIK